jgi:hypothetical protein
VRARRSDLTISREASRILGNLVTVPKLYAMYRMPLNGHLCLIMERLTGRSLEWPTLDEDEKSAICSKLKDAFAAIRKIRHPGFYGSVEKGPVPHHLFHSAEA